MLPLPVLVFAALLVELPISYSRPSDKSHGRGLYDDWKTVPFVDNPDDSGDMFGEYVNKLGNPDNTNTYQQLYEKHSKEHGIVLGDGNYSNGINETSEHRLGDVDKNINPVEGGLEDMSINWSEGQVRSERKHRRDRENRKGNRHHKSVKKDLSEDEKEGKELSREKRIKNQKNKKITENADENNYGDGIDIDRFYKEHPNFETNAATISDIKVETYTSTPGNYATSDNTDSSTSTDAVQSDSEDDADMKIKFDDDQKEVKMKESKSGDESSKAFVDYYNYYDKAGDSSYSSSEETAEQEIQNPTPYDWFQQYDRMYGDQPAQSETQSDKSGDANSSSDEDDNNKYSKAIEDKRYVASDRDNIPKTDVEPSTSPNPPTPKKDMKSTVTQPAYPQWKERVETWNLIESKPIESCGEDMDCPSGRMCKFELCLCGQPDFCEGHYKPVCGSDRRMYTSHCELHRTACVLGVHIKFDEAVNCQPKVDDIVDLVKTDDSSTSQPDAGDERESEDATTTVGPDTTTLIVIKDTNEIQPDETLEHGAKQRIDTTLKTAFDHIKFEEEYNKAKTVHVNIPDDVKGLKITKNVNTAAMLNQQLVKDSKNDIGDADGDDRVVKISTLDGKFDFEADYEDDDDYEEDDYDEDDTDEDDSDEDDDYDSDDDDYHDVGTDDSEEELDEISQVGEASLVPLFCTPDLYQKFKADVLEYHCIYFEELHCDRQTQKEKQKLAAVMFNYFDRDFSGHVEKEEFWELQLLEHMDEISSLCTLLDIVTFDELGERDGKVSIDEFIQAFDIPDLLEHKTEVVPLLATVGNGLEVKCDITDSTDIVWKRNDIDLGLIDFPGISVLGDGSLYLETVGFHHVGNLSCHDRQKPSIKQVHRLTVQKPPRVMMHIKSHDCFHGDTFEIRCHAEGYPKPTITWKFEDEPVQQGSKYHIQAYDSTLTVLKADYTADSGTYKCHARNTAGEGEGTVMMTVHSLNETTHTGDFNKVQESFIIFHNNGYTLHEPSECLTQRHVLPDFGNFYFIPDELDAPPSLCEKGIPCIWGGAVRIKDIFVYASQPRENRVLVIDVEDTYNPNQVISTDHMPVSVHYVAHLDEVWVLCWNGEEDKGSKTVVIIRNASQRTQHHAIHTQPIGNRFDQVQEIFLAGETELHHPYKYGYTVHSGQQGLFKVNLEEKKYTRAVDFTKYNCVPKSVAFMPIGGHSLVQCVKKTPYGITTNILTLDYITDTVTDNVTLSSVPYVSPDVSSVIMVDEETGKISVHRITENGDIVHQFDVTVSSTVGKVVFHKARYSHGYDIYLTATEYPFIYSVSLETGKVDTIKDIREPDTELFLPWFKKGRPIVSGGIFSNFLGTTAMSSMMILNGKHHTIQCDYRELENPSVVAYTHLRS